MNDCVRNPHSGAKVSRSVNEVEQLRSSIYILANTTPDEYMVVFTHNTTDSIQTLGRLLKVDSTSSFSYLVDNHNSILGLAEMFRNKGMTVKCVDTLPNEEGSHIHIFAFPLHSNFNGKTYQLEWISEYQKTNGIVILDAASTLAPDLSRYKPDFVVLSLLKLAGSHGGVLLVRRDRLDLLKDPPPAGGNLLYSCSRNGKFKLMTYFEKKFESGTIAYTDLLLALEGIRVRNSFGTEAQITEHVYSVSKRFREAAESMKHSNGQPLFVFYPEKSENTSIHSFNLLTNDGKIINHQEIQFIFDVNKVSVRIGSHCNPGATFTSLGWTDQEVIEFSSSQTQGEKCVSSLCVVNDRPVATIRVSFGYPSTNEDADKFLSLISRMFLNGGPNPESEPIKLPFTIERMFVFPIVAAGGYEVKSSKVDNYGFEYDRRWKLFSEEGSSIGAPQCPSVATLIAIVQDGQLCLRYRDHILKVPVEGFDEYENPPSEVSKYGKVYSKDVSMFLYQTLGRYLYLVKLEQKFLGKMAFSAITKESLSLLPQGYNYNRFYASLLLSGQPPFTEEGDVEQPMKCGNMLITRWRWRVLCMTSSVEPFSENIEVDSLKTIADERSRYGVTPFGVLFGVDADEDSVLSVGDVITTAY
ncbi:MOSC N-terminal beta barrel domain containing protein [Histomonas meleagridis]|uniref:MOSC N-terminal beta barrel domain containing protein n=1 Tax=Histomonas meleagridis TaxID=135588 RepID=UPI00355937EB|nr:MOSC N-terminal beta barrel domain containing protein [Histomonas meleagridis]KAH0802175.1 MOSC N-terminal beta barrel domain containing protein [Histomonas meleagridis]